MAKVRVVKGDNRTGYVDEAQLATARAQGWEPATEEEAAAKKARREASGVVGSTIATGEAALRGASLGFSDSALRALGVDAKGIATRKEALGNAAGQIELVGAIAPALLSGGSSAVGSAARLTLAGRAAQAGRAITGATEAAAGRGLVGRVGGAALAGGFEGAVAGAGGAASELALGDRDLAAEALLAGTRRGAGLGALFGAGGATLGIGLEHAYRGGQRVSRDLLGKAMGGGDVAPGKAAPEGLAHTLMRRQMQFLRASPDDMAAAERSLGRTRTEAGRKLTELADAKPSVVDAAVGERLRAAAGATTADAAVAAWQARVRPGAATRKAVAQRGWDGWGRLAKVGAKSKGLDRLRKALKATEPETFDDYLAERAKVSRALGALQAEGDEALYQRGLAAAKDFLDAGDDAALWGGNVGQQHAAIRAAHEAETVALKKLTPSARAALRGAATNAKGVPYDGDKLARALGKADPAAVAEVVAARRTLAGALEEAGEDVTALRKGLDDLEQAAGYRGEVAAAREDLRRVAALRARDSGGRFQDPAEALLPEQLQGAVRGLREVTKGTGLASTALRGLSLGGTALGDLVRKVGTVAGKPAATLRVVARARGGIDAVRAQHAGAVAAFSRLADGAADTARGVAKGVRRVPPAVSRQQQRERQRETIDAIARVGRLAGDPNALASEMGPATVELRAAAPNVAGAVIAGAARAAAYLRAVAPPIYKPTGSGGEPMVDPFALETWRRKHDAVAEPGQAFKRAATGTATKEEAEALAAVYPRLWADFREQIMVEVGKRARDGKPMSFASRTALGIIGGVAADDSLRPTDYAAIQASMHVEPPHPPAPPPRSQIKPTAPNLPKWQALEAKA